jgi:hypothetical protein
MKAKGLKQFEALCEYPGALLRGHLCWDGMGWMRQFAFVSLSQQKPAEFLVRDH